MGKQDELIVGLDIGTTKIACLVGEISGDQVNIIGVGTHPSYGLKKGVVVNIDSTVQSIRKAIEEAEHMAGVQIRSVFAGIAGAHIKALNSEGMVAVKEREVRAADIERVLDASKAIHIPQDREIIHVVPQEYTVDDQDGIRDPVGMSGVRLEAKVHIVTAAVTSVQNIVKCCTRCDLQVSDIVLEPLASAEAVLQAEEKELGVGLLDIGGGTSDLVIYHGGSVIHTAVLPVGGNQLTNDLAIGLRTPLAEAERIKRKHGCALAEMISQGETIEVPSVGGRPPRTLPRQVVCDILSPRVQEIFELVKREIERLGLADALASGLVVTGGSTILEGLPELAEMVLQMPVRRGIPQGMGGLMEVVQSPVYATGVGLVLYGAKQQQGHHFPSSREVDKQTVWKRIAAWFKQKF